MVNSSTPVLVAWPDRVRYAVWQEQAHEVSAAATTHGYIEFYHPVKAPKSILPTARFSQRQGSRDEARASCCQGGLPFHEHGTWSLAQGKRTDLAKAATPATLTTVLMQMQTLADENLRLSESVQQLASIVQEKACLLAPCTTYIPPVTNIVHHTTSVVNNIVNNNTITNHNTANIANIVIHDLGCEDLSEFPSERLRSLVSQHRMGFLTFVRETRFNPEKPQNRNFKIVSKKQNLAAVKRDGVWKQGSIAQSLEAALDKSTAQFFSPLSDDEYRETLMESEPPTVDWCQKMMAKNRSEWWPIKASVRAELEKTYQDERCSFRQLQ